jgi:cell fate regulator YaaT (PSP1 superfamily)
MSYRVVGVRFKRAGKVYYFDPAEDQFSIGDDVIVETSRGMEYGQVVIGPAEIVDEDVVTPLKKVLRKATGQDRERLAVVQEKEKQAYHICEQKIVVHGLLMKLVDVEKTFDESKITFYFTAEGRIDFRDLVKDLAAVFRTRIELRQIGVRDEAKMMGGLGCCGRELCCATWLSDFVSVSIRMAKEQNLSLNPTKISGICGRLMCCLKYENDIYEQGRQEYPPVNSWMMTPDGEGKINSINIFKKTVTVELKDRGMIREYAFPNVSPVNTGGDQCASADCTIQTGGSQDSGIGERSSKDKRSDSKPDGRKCCAQGATGCGLRAGREK